jgi:hypothetical protein
MRPASKTFIGRDYRVGVRAVQEFLAPMTSSRQALGRRGLEGAARPSCRVCRLSARMAPHKESVCGQQGAGSNGEQFPHC